MPSVTAAGCDGAQYYVPLNNSQWICALVQGSRVLRAPCSWTLEAKIEHLDVRPAEPVSCKITQTLRFASRLEGCQKAQWGLLQIPELQASVTPVEVQGTGLILNAAAIPARLGQILQAYVYCPLRTLRPCCRRLTLEVSCPVDCSSTGD